MTLALGLLAALAIAVGAVLRVSITTELHTPALGLIGLGAGLLFIGLILPGDSG